MPANLIDGINLWGQIFNNQYLAEWLEKNVSMDVLLEIPGVSAAIRDDGKVMGEFISSKEGEFGEDFHNYGRFTLHQSSVDDPKKAHKIPVAYANNPQSLIEVGKTMWGDNQDMFYFIFDYDGAEVGFIGDDGDGFLATIY